MNKAGGPRISLVLLLILPIGCRQIRRVKAGDKVHLRYELFSNGVVVESNLDGDPVPITQGAGEVPPGADEALIGMAPGEERQLDLGPEKAFGPRDPARVESLPLSKLGELAHGLLPGHKVLGFRDGKASTAVVLAVKDGKALLDFNSPLAGKTVVYRLRVVSIP